MKSKCRLAIWVFPFLALRFACESGDGGSPPLSTKEWTWVSGSSTADQAGTYGTKGTADSLNVPGARTGAVARIDSGGLLWLFGGYGRGRFNDLWRYIR